ncbi:DNA mismatch repair protein MutS [Lachnospiraceae bacterium RM5]|nr:DNA mismatch repair protein MutS [Lachnospiraceae bacterium RM5]
MEQLSPMMRQYVETKKKYNDCILFYRLGDFYEMFFEDATLVSRELELTLTGKECGLEERAPMCGVPHHAADSYISKLVSKGYKVAIAEQVEDPKLAKGLVKREVIRVVTPGTNLDTDIMEEGKNNYIMCVAKTDEIYGVAICDVSTGEFMITEVDSLRLLYNEINKFMPSELVVNSSFYMSGINTDDLKKDHISVSTLENEYFDEDESLEILRNHFNIKKFSDYGLNGFKAGLYVGGALMKYLLNTQMNSLSHISTIRGYSTSKYMLLDISTRRNLELTETLRDKEKRGSLLWVLDKTKTAMGARKLRKYIEQPLINIDEIRKRQDAIEEMNGNLISREELREYLNSIYDIERLIAKISYQTANPRDLIAFKNSLKMLPYIKMLLKDFSKDELKGIYENFDELKDIYDLIDKALDEDPPISVKDGGIIKEGYFDEVDKLRQAKNEGKQWIAKLEADEKEKTGIKTLKVKYNKVFGYCIEVSNSYKNSVPAEYVRKQTLANNERYITDELKKLENVILGAEDKLIALEYDIFVEIRNKIANEFERIKRSADLIAKLDVYASLAYVADHNDFVKPKLNEKNIIDIKEGRHPVVEKMIKDSMFITNDTYLDNSNSRISIITGPNMAGKSTYMRQTALICLMAQIGSFVPAKSANICISDRIFTRVGASDDLASGQSTFMVEMNEVANILKNATNKSLLILDEIGRGTSTFDGLSIAWAVVEHISNPKLIGAKTLFATHYHELTELEGTIKGVKNYCIAVKEQGDDIIFLRKIIRGGADKSYGIQVAKLAGLPISVIERAKEIVEELVNADISTKAKEIAISSKPVKKENIFIKNDVNTNQISLFDTIKDDDIIEELKNMDITSMTPIDALNELYKLQNKLKNRY